MAKQDVTVELFYDGDWQDATLDEKVYTSDTIEIVHGRPGGELGSTLTPSRSGFTLDDRSGNHNPRNPVSPLFGIARNLPARISVGGEVRLAAEASAWTPGRPVKGPAWVKLDVAGPLYRLGQGNPPARSALHRSTLADDTVAGYWPMEDIPEGGAPVIPAGVGPDARQRTTRLVGIAPITPMKWSEETQLAGSGALPTLYTEFGTAGIEADGMAVAPDPALGLMFWTRTAVPEQSVANQLFTGVTFFLMLQNTAFTVARYVLQFVTYPPGSTVADGDTAVSGGNVVVRAGTASTLPLDYVFEDAPYLDQWRHVYARLSQNGSNVDVSIRLDNVVIATGTITGVTLDTVRGIKTELLTSDSSATNRQVDPVSAGHFTAMSGSTSALDDAAEMAYQAGLGYVGEAAGTRFLRLCAEEGITTATINGTEADTVPMGPQLPGPLIRLLRDIEATDGGVVHDTRGELGLTMRTGRSLWNQDPALELDYAAFEIAPVTDPVLDDLHLHNDVTATRDGVSARAVLESGPLNVSDPSVDPQGAGRYTHQVDVNPCSDLLLGDHAQWHLHLGTVDETRWPQVVVIDSDKLPGLIERAAAVDVGDRITIENMPADLSPDVVSLVVVGYTETVGTHTRRIAFTCVPEKPYHIAEVEHARYSIIGNNTTHRAAGAGAIDTTQTTMDLAVGAGRDWSFETAFDIEVGGEVMTVTAIGAASGTYPDRVQNFTVVRSVNGVVKSHPEESLVRVVNRSYIGL